MVNHPNIKKNSAGIPPASPTPDQVREVRALAGQTQTEAAKTIHGALLTWQRYEARKGLSMHRHMPAAAWELYLLRCAQKGVLLPSPMREYIADTWPEIAHGNAF